MLDLTGLRAFSQVIDYTYGGSNGQYKLSSTFLGDEVLELRYKAIFQFIDHVTLKEQKDRFSKESETLILELLKNAKKAYNDETKSTKLRPKLESDVDDVQMVDMTIYSPRQTAYYTRVMTYHLN